VSLLDPSALIVALKRARDESTLMCGLNMRSPWIVAVMSGYCFDEEASTIQSLFHER